jgi:hypothetical protein
MAHPEGYPPLKAKYEYVDSDSFIALCKNAEVNNFNRQCETPLIEKNIDPDGTHILGLSFVHNGDHMRTQWLVKMIDEDEPVTLYLDVTFEALRWHKRQGT